LRSRLSRLHKIVVNRDSLRNRLFNFIFILSTFNFIL
jgi:hypothetical protein